MKEKIRECIGKVPKWVRMVVATVVIVAVAVVVDYFVQIIIHRGFCEVVEDDFSCVFQIDSVKQKNDDLVIEGWFFKLGEDSRGNDFDVILYDYINDKEYYLEVKYKKREDVNEYFLCEYDYSDSGFKAFISTEKIELRNINYEILVQNSSDRQAYKTGVYIYDGEILYVKPEEYIPLEVNGTDIENIVNKGILRVYRPDIGLFVYQYEKKFYWITDENYEFNDGKSTYVQYQLDTTQIDRLPKKRLDGNWFWDNKGFIFEDQEIMDLNTGKYRVTVAMIPAEYSITKIWTGCYESGWKWKQNFRPWYVFD